MREMETFIVFEDGSTRLLQLAGRDAWALDELIKAGPNGCTPLDNPGPRWSAYVFKLKTKYGLCIETITEQHAGPFSGHHARYVLHTRAVRAASQREAA